MISAVLYSRALRHAATLIALTLSLGSDSAHANHFELFVLTGQSNSLGVTNGGETDPSIGSDPSDANVIYFWENLANKMTSLGDSGDTFKTLQETQGGYYAGSASHWGPEISCARTLYRAGMRNFGFIKASRGGGGNTLWSSAPGNVIYLGENRVTGGRLTRRYRANLPIDAESNTFIRLRATLT